MKQQQHAFIAGSSEFSPIFHVDISYLMQMNIINKLIGNLLFCLNCEANEKCSPYF